MKMRLDNTLSTATPYHNNIQIKINKVKNDLDTIHGTKTKIINYLEEKKSEIRKNYSLSQYVPFFEQRIAKFPWVYIAAKIVSMLDRSISLIQNTHDMLVNDLMILKKNLEDNVELVKQTEYIMNILNYKMYDVQYRFRVKMDDLEQTQTAVRKSSLTDRSETEISLKLVELDKAITECQDAYNKEIQSIKHQKIDAQQEFENVIAVMDTNFEKMCQRYDNLLLLIETEKANVSESQTELVDAKVFIEADNFKKCLETFGELHKTGWKVTSCGEDIAAILEERGLKLSKSGILFTKSGERISYEEAKSARLLEDIKINWSDIINLQGDTYKKKESIAQGFASTECLSNTASKMLTEDITYLKDTLGKPLTMALAEITAVQPRDPIHYLGHWLFKYRYNQEKDDIDKIEFDALNEERTRIAQERWHQFIEQEARAAVIEMITRAEEQALMNELKRIEREFQNMEEENRDNLDDEARDVLGEYNGPVTGQNL